MQFVGIRHSGECWTFAIPPKTKRIIIPAKVESIVVPVKAERIVILANARIQ